MSNTMNEPWRVYKSSHHTNGKKKPKVIRDISFRMCRRDIPEKQLRKGEELITLFPANVNYPTAMKRFKSLIQGA